jgi:hypothetical protein
VRLLRYSQYYFGYLGSVEILMIFRMGFSACAKNVIGVLIGIALNQ